MVNPDEYLLLEKQWDNVMSRRPPLRMKHHYSIVSNQVLA